ncbi:hypothetical protein [Kordia jejudonensis]|uniref:hypothetical protein n=1 Tax=Kordia jejudonensis TaxID=1348245 RepID=UPI000629BDAB|nr:hypothetical protein [Kordia jejudonensis]
MKKKLLFIILAGCITACTIDEVTMEGSSTIEQPEQPVAVCFVDPNNPPAVFGSQWNAVSFVIETPVDGNGDGVFSTDLFEESSCTISPIIFRDDFKATNPLFVPISLRLLDDGNGNLVQNIDCNGIIDGLFPTYSQEQDIVYFCYSGQIEFTGTLSNNDQTLTIEFTNDLLFGFNITGGNQLLRQNGTVESYEGGAIVTFERI